MRLWVYYELSNFSIISYSLLYLYKTIIHLIFSLNILNLYFIILFKLNLFKGEALF